LVGLALPEVVEDVADAVGEDEIVAGDVEDGPSLRAIVIA
jgi:hypothetical protein